MAQTCTDCGRFVPPNSDTCPHCHSDLETNDGSGGMSNVGTY